MGGREYASWFMEGALVVVVGFGGETMRLSRSMFTPRELHVVGLSDFYWE